jgi:hypothetical protein
VARLIQGVWIGWEQRFEHPIVARTRLTRGRLTSVAAARFIRERIIFLARAMQPMRSTFLAALAQLQE